MLYFDGMKTFITVKMAGWNFWELNSIRTCKDDTDLGKMSNKYFDLYKRNSVSVACESGSFTLVDCQLYFILPLLPNSCVKWCSMK